ncbi:hypothetical protein [Rhizobium leguminosarum]|uniref:hypothetical protein n=1 Tax=Rhizobium leguminosarum TaxID=384 RepID=UPI001C938F5D|nr:hypothetical protein [Rhizobium leguminosarum]MBY5741253.1 hypothetical protein [Rhizobium leguminosarum]
MGPKVSSPRIAIAPIPERHRDWLKIKCIQSESFAIVGWEQSMVARAHIGTLLLGAMKEGKLVYIGSDGTGIKDSEAWKLRELMENRTARRALVAYSGGSKDTPV